MKTKHLLTAIALPALFAACTAEDVTTADNIVKDNLENRPVVGEVTISLGEQSRATVENYNKITFKEGDKLGVALVDVWNKADNDPIKRYNLLTQSINTNYIFTSDAEGHFTSEAAMVEGNYVFYYPYNGMRNRNQILTNLPKEQALTKMADGSYTSYPSVLAYSEEVGAPIAVAYDFLSEADAGNELTGTLKQIYATPLFTLENTATKKNAAGEDEPISITIKQIILTKDGGFTLSAPLEFASSAQTAYSEANGVATSIVSALFDETISTALANQGVTQGPWESSILNRKTGMMLGDAVDGGTSTSITLTLEKPVTVAAEGKFSFYAVIPAEDYTNGTNLTVTVYNAEGKSQDVTFSNVALTAGQRYPEGEFNQNEIVNADARGVSLTNIVDGGFELTGQLVSTVDELVSAIRNAEAEEDLSLRMTGSAVINSRVANLLALENSTKASKIEFVNEVAFDGPSITWAPVHDVEFDAAVTINEGAVVEINDTGSAFKNGVNNKGTLNYKDGALGALTNSGTLNLYGGLDETTTDVVSTGNVTVSKTSNSATIVTLKSLTNGNCDSKVAATLKVDAGATLNTSVTNEEGATLANEGVVYSVANHGTVNNGSEENGNAVINNVTENATSATGYTALINNYGTLEGTKNSGKIVMKDINAVAYVIDGNGAVENDVLALVSNSSNNTVTYTMTGSVKSNEIDAANLATNSITQVILKNVTLSVIDNMNFGNLNVKISGSTSFNSAKGANAGLKVELGVTEKVALTVPTGSKLTVNAGVVLCGNYTASGTIVNKGIVTTGGSTEISLVGTVEEFDAAFKNNKKIILTEDLNFDFTGYVDESSSLVGMTKDVNIDGNGKTLTVKSLRQKDGKSLTLSNLTLQSTDNEAYAVWNQGGKIVMNNVTINENKNYELCFYGGGDVTLNGCKVSGNPGNDDYSNANIWVGDGRHLTINGGTYGSIFVNASNGANVLSAGSITLNSGTIDKLVLETEKNTDNTGYKSAILIKNGGTIDTLVENPKNLNLTGLERLN